MLKKAIVCVLGLALLCPAMGSALAAAPSATSVTPARSAPSATRDAAASGDLDARLAEVTQKVKRILGIGDEYTSFYGNYNEWNPAGTWSLSWGSDTQSLSVEAGEDGKIYSYNHFLNKQDDGYRPYESGSRLGFPTTAEEEARAAAQTFLKGVLAPNESVTLEANRYDIIRGSDANLSFYGPLRLNGLEGSGSVHITVRGVDLKVSNYYRYEGGPYIGGVPDARPGVTAAAAKAALESKVALELRYVLEQEAGEDARAVLRYVPVTKGNYIVDAKTGALIDLEEVYANLRTGAAAPAGGSSMAEAPEATKDMEMGGLTEAERSGIEKLAGVLDRDALDRAARGISVLGISPAYSLSRVSYSADPEGEQVTAYLNYYLGVTEAKEAGISDRSLKKLREDGYTPVIYKNLSLDAKTGDLIQVNTYYSGFGYRNETPKAAPGALSASAKAFLTRQAGEKLAETKAEEPQRLYSGDVFWDEYRYVRTANGHPFPENLITLSVNGGTGTVDSYWESWTEDLAFDAAEGILSAGEALSAYSAAHTIELHYADYPILLDLSRPELSPYLVYLERGYSYLYEMRLAYRLSAGAGYVYGIDAKTGEALRYEASEGPAISYRDIDGISAEEKILTLARYRIGFYDELFHPQFKLDQRSMLRLLASLEGYVFTDEGAQNDEKLEQIGVWMGVVEAGTFAPEEIVTRAQMAKALVCLTGYGGAARLSGIHVCGFSDDPEIPGELYGYVAIAKGFGIVGGYSDGTFRPNQAVTRAEAAVMLYQFMARDR